MDTVTKNAIREALLLAQSKWLESAEHAPTPVEKIVAHAIATAFGAEANEYKIPDQARAAINFAAYDNFAKDVA